MKKSLIIISVFSSIFLYHFGHSFMRYGYGDSTGAPLKKEVVTSRTSCNTVGCHVGNEINSNRLSATHSIISNIPSTGWETGETYTITVKTESPEKDVFGFQFLAWGNQDSSSVGILKLLDNENTKLASSSLKNSFYQTVDTLQYITHNGPNSVLAKNKGSHEWSFEWIAPTTKTQDVFFYTTFVAANGNGKTSGDYVFQVSSPANKQLVNLTETNKQILYTVFPTHVENIANINLGSFVNTSHHITIQNTAGKIIYDTETFNNTQIDVSNFLEGIYIVSIQNLETNYIEHTKIYK